MHLYIYTNIHTYIQATARLCAIATIPAAGAVWITHKHIYTYIHEYIYEYMYICVYINIQKYIQATDRTCATAAIPETDAVCEICM